MQCFGNVLSLEMFRSGGKKCIFFRKFCLRTKRMIPYGFCKQEWKNDLYAVAKANSMNLCYTRTYQRTKISQNSYSFQNSHQIFLPIRSTFKPIDQLLFPPRSSESRRFPFDFKGIEVNSLKFAQCQKRNLAAIPQSSKIFWLQSMPLVICVFQ